MFCWNSVFLIFIHEPTHEREVTIVTLENPGEDILGLEDMNDDSFMISDYISVQNWTMEFLLTLPSLTTQQAKQLRRRKESTSRPLTIIQGTLDNSRLFVYYRHFIYYTQTSL